jgi:hypothetical protein
MNLESDVFQTIPPLFQPLRLWTPRVSSSQVTRSKIIDSGSVKKASLRIFSIKGGFVNVAGGERRLMIAGKLFRNME